RGWHRGGKGRTGPRLPAIAANLDLRYAVIAAVGDSAGPGCLTEEDGIEGAGQDDLRGHLHAGIVVPAALLPIAAVARVGAGADALQPLWPFHTVAAGDEEASGEAMVPAERRVIHFKGDHHFRPHRLLQRQAFLVAVG